MHGTAELAIIDRLTEFRKMHTFRDDIHASNAADMHNTRLPDALRAPAVAMAT